MVPHVEHLWTILCKVVGKDAQGGLALIGLIDMIHVPDLPENGKLGFDCHVLSYWRRNFDPGTVLRQRLVMEYQVDGRRWPLAGEEKIVVTDRHLYCAITPIHHFPIGGYGQHMVVVQRQDAPDGEWSDALPTAGIWVASTAMMASLPPPT
jgi:hypothetical protein